MAMLVGTTSGLVAVDGGGDVRGVGFEGHDVLALSGGWALLDGHEVRRRDGRDGGQGVSVAGPALTCLCAGGGGPLLAGSAEGHLYRFGEGEGARRVESFEHAEGRGDWYTPWGGPPDVRSLSVSDDGVVLVNVHVGGILRSADDGASWQATIDLHDDVHQVLALPGGAAVAACATGLATSFDGGATWSVHDEGLHATYCRAVAVSGDTVLMSASAGPGGGHAALYRRPVTGGGALERCRTGLPDDLGGNVDTFWLAGDATGAAVVATASGALYASGDAGATWEQVAGDITGVRCLVLA